MIAIIDSEAIAAGLPPPLLLSVPDASQLGFVLQGDRAGPSVVQLMAARNGEGTSTIARDLCLVAAANGSRTVLLAAETPARQVDWPRTIYGMPSGLLPSTDSPRSLDIVPVGDSRLSLATPTGTVAMLGPAWVSILTHLRERFDFIVVDSPALERAFIGIMLAPHIHTTAIVVAAESTRASAARALRGRLAEAGGATAGVILNKRRYHVPRAAYERL